MRSLEERFWSKVDKNGPNGCWVWTGCIGHGYGQIRQNKKLYQAHRVSWEWAVGPIPNGMEIDHRCRVKQCVNPDHLRVVTHKQNLENLDRDRGASFHPASGRWHARVEHNGRTYHGRYFDTREEALQAAADLRRELFTHNDEDRT